jgi:hypothetical protein
MAARARSEPQWLSKWLLEPASEPQGRSKLATRACFGVAGALEIAARARSASTWPLEVAARNGRSAASLEHSNWPLEPVRPRWGARNGRASLLGFAGASEIDAQACSASLERSNSALEPARPRWCARHRSSSLGVPQRNASDHLSLRNAQHATVEHPWKMRPRYVTSDHCTTRNAQRDQIHRSHAQRTTRNRRAPGGHLASSLG